MMAEDLTLNEFWKKKVYRAIRVRDANKDGYISKADFELIVQRYKDIGAPEEHLKKLDKVFTAHCVRYDLTDESAKLTYDQFAAMLARTAKNKDEDKRVDFFKSMFVVIDIDGNGEISFQEWVEFYKAMGIDTQYARASFDAMDANKDGIISKKEFAAYINEYFFSSENKLNSSILYGPLD